MCSAGAWCGLAGFFGKNVYKYIIIMERIVQSFEEGDYDMVAMLVLLDNLAQGELERLVHFFVYKLVDKKIPEFVFVELMQYTARTRIDFGLLKHIKEIIELLGDDNYNVASELLIVLCDMKDASKRLNKFIEDAISDSVLGSRLLDVGVLTGGGEGIGNEVVFLMAIGDAERYIKAFTKPPLSLPDDMSPGGTNTPVKKYDQKYINEQFEIYYREEILNRLILLRNYYSLKLLENIKVDILSIIDFDNLSYTEAVIYYCLCVKKIKHCMVMNMKLCKNYISFREHYNALLDSNARWKEVVCVAEPEVAVPEVERNVEILEFIRDINMNRKIIEMIEKGRGDDLVDVRIEVLDEISVMIFIDIKN